jgi:hypothetical protein
VQVELARLRARETDRGRKLTHLPELLAGYEKVFEQALENGFVQDAALAKELAWQVLSEAADQTSAESLYSFRKWGADGVVRNRKGLHVIEPVKEKSQDLPSSTTNRFSTTTEILTSALDLDAVVLASQQLSSKLDTKALLRSAMDLILANTGATKVCFIFFSFSTLLFY